MTDIGTVQCYADEDGMDVIGLVPYTSNLDHWDGNNYTSGSTGCHIGIGKTKSGKWYVCYGTQWQGSQDTAYLISADRAKQLCLNHDPGMYEELFGEPVPEP